MTKPSMDLWLAEAKQDSRAAECGMYLFHTGVVRASAKAQVRGGESAAPVRALRVSYDAQKVAAAESAARAREGIFYVRVWLNEGELVVGEAIMQVLVGGDIRPRVIEALQALIDELKHNCISERELF